MAAAAALGAAGGKPRSPAAGGAAAAPGGQASAGALGAAAPSIACIAWPAGGPGRGSPRRASLGHAAPRRDVAGRGLAPPAGPSLAWPARAGEEDAEAQGRLSGRPGDLTGAQGAAGGRPSNSSSSSDFSAASSIRAIPGCLAHCGYHALAFFAYWFGAARFDANGDGEFDAADVQRMIHDVGLHMRLSFSRPIPRGRRLREMARSRAARVESELEAKRERRRRRVEHLRELRGDAAGEGEGHGGGTGPRWAALAMAGERARHGIDVACDMAAQVAEASVEPDVECVETTIRDNLRQYLPWFTILQVCVCFGLWLWYAAQTNQYLVLAEHVSVDDSLLVGKFSGISRYECHLECSNLGDACWGVAFLEGLATQCKLLSAAPKEEHTGSWNCDVARSCCREGAWNWVLSVKQPRSLFGAIGGLEAAYPGQTALQSFRYCEEGFKASIFWRLLSYQFTHIGLGHVGINCFMIFLLGVPLEGFHGTGLTALMYTIGVVGGGLAWMHLDPYAVAHGASGGAYALLGMHTADLILNWKQKIFRYSELLLLVVVTAVDTALYFSSVKKDTYSSAHSVHAGGLVSGLLVGIVLTRNIDKKRWERVLQAVALLAGNGLICFGLVWWLSSPFPGIRSLWGGGEGPLCWIGQVCTNADNTGCDYSIGWQCVACSTRECVENWYKDELPFCVTMGGQEVCDGSFADIVHNCLNC